VFAAIALPRADQAYMITVSFMVGTIVRTDDISDLLQLHWPLSGGPPV
jgi:hypothetical protein